MVARFGRNTPLNVIGALWLGVVETRALVCFSMKGQRTSSTCGSTTRASTNGKKNEITNIEESYVLDDDAVNAVLQEAASLGLTTEIPAEFKSDVDRHLEELDKHAAEPHGKHVIGGVGKHGIGGGFQGIQAGSTTMASDADGARSCTSSDSFRSVDDMNPIQLLILSIQKCKHLRGFAAAMQTIAADPDNAEKLASSFLTSSETPEGQETEVGHGDGT